MAKLQVDNDQRFVAGELLNSSAITYASVEHEIYRIAHTYKDGLTPAEVAFLLKRCDVLKKELELMVKFRERIRKSSRGPW